MCEKILMKFYANVDNEEVRMSFMSLYKYNEIKVT